MTFTSNRLLGNGYCTRPVGVDCIHETICEQCSFFETGPQFVTLLRRQRNDATKRGDPTKATLFDELIHGIDTPA
jgi:hypothetical protein